MKRNTFVRNRFCIVVLFLILSDSLLAEQITFIQEETRNGVNWKKANYEGPRIPPASGDWNINFGLTRPQPASSYSPGSGTKYPLIVYLHGAGARGALNNALDRSTARHFALAAINDPCNYNAFVLAGSVASSSYRWVEYDWSSGVYTQTNTAGNTYGEYMHSLELLLDYIINTDNNSELMSILGIQAQDIDLTRVYVVGDSMGAYGTWDLLARKPELFAAGITSGGSGPKNKTTELLQSAIWAIHGEMDSTVPNYVPGDGSNPDGAGSIGILYWLQEELQPGTDWDGDSSTSYIYWDDPEATNDDPLSSNRLVYSEYPNTEHNPPAASWTEIMDSDFKAWLFSQSSDDPALEAPQITSTPITTVTAGQLYEYNVDATGNPTPTYSIESSPLDGMSIETNTGLISWIPDANYLGINTVTVRASNSEGYDEQVFDINVTGATPVITSQAPTVAYIGWLYVYDVEATGIPSVTYYLSEDSPNDMTIDPNTGMIQWVPTYIEDVNVTIIAVNGELPDGLQTFTISVSYPSIDIELDSVTSAFNGDQNDTLTWSHSIGSGEGRCLIVALAAEDAFIEDLALDSVTYAGVEMVSVPNSVALATGYYQQTALYYLLDANLPPTGTYPVIATYRGLIDDRIGAAFSMFNVDQDYPFEDVNTNANIGSDSIVTGITTSVDGCWIIDIVGCGNAGYFTPVAPDMNEQFDVSPDSSSAAGATRIAEFAGSYQMSWTHTNGNRMAHSVVALLPLGRLIGDINGDGLVNYIDLDILSRQWLQPPGTPSADIEPIPGDSFVNFLDFAAFAQNFIP